MNNAVEEIRRQYTYAVQPVKFFEARNFQAAQKDNFDFIHQMQTSGNNPFHPSVSNTEKGNKLDIMS